jgi:hypothetical protein
MYATSSASQLGLVWMKHLEAQAALCLIAQQNNAKSRLACDKQ